MPNDRIADLHARNSCDFRRALSSCYIRNEGLPVVVGAFGTNNGYRLANRNREVGGCNRRRIVANGVDSALIVGVGSGVGVGLITIRNNAVVDRRLVPRRLFALSVGRGHNLGLGRLLILRDDGYLGLGLRGPFPGGNCVSRGVGPEGLPQHEGGQRDGCHLAPRARHAAPRGAILAKHRHCLSP